MTDYETKDSGQRQQWESGMMRDVQTGKPRFALVVTSAQPYEDQMLTRYARLLARGAEKYEDRNWEQGSGDAELEYAKESLLRHTMQLITGETDEDHAAATWFNVQVIEYIRWRQRVEAEQVDLAEAAQVERELDSYEEAQAYAQGRTDQARDDEYARRWVAEYDKEHPAAKSTGWVNETQLQAAVDHSHPGRAGGFYDGPQEVPANRIGTWGDERALQDEIERQLSPAPKRNETPFSQAVERFSEAGGFESAESIRLTEDQLDEAPVQVHDLLRAERGAAERLLAFPIVPAPNPVQLGLDRDQRSL